MLFVVFTFWTTESMGEYRTSYSPHAIFALGRNYDVRLNHERRAETVHLKNDETEKEMRWLFVTPANKRCL